MFSVPNSGNRLRNSVPPHQGVKSLRVWHSFLLVVWSWLVAGLSCGAAETGTLRLATFRCDVTPPLGGHPIIWVTPLKTVEDPLWAKGVILEDGPKRYVLCAVDWCGLCNSTHLLFRRKIAAAADTEVSQVSVHCVHQHTAPYTDGDAQHLLDQVDKAPRFVDFKFLDEVTDRLAAQVRQALQNLQPFDQVGVGQAKVERVASSRRIPLPGGKIQGRSSSAPDPRLRALPEGNIDPLLRTITLARGKKPLVRMHYYATHPQSFYGDPRASADTAGHARDRLEKKEQVFQIYFNGCGGDVAMGKYNDRTPQARRDLTDRLFAGMEASVAASRLSPVAKLQWRTLPLVLPARTDPGYTEADFRKMMANLQLPDHVRARAATNVAYTLRSREPLTLAALQMGPAQVLHLPGECMVDFQQYAQGLLPGRFVAIAAYADLGPGYICTERAFQEGGYEPSASRVAPQSEHLLKRAMADLLQVQPPGRAR